MHFGQFLIQQGAITPRQILDALDEQRRSTPFLGTLAVAQEAMTVEQVLEVLDAAQDFGSKRKQFGELAVEMGFLDQETCARLVELQRRSFAPLGEVLVRQDALDPSEMAALLKAFIKSARVGQGAERG